jgi:hypothetical protein
MGGPAPDEPEEPPYHTWATALSSPGSWLETDTDQIARGAHRYEAQSDYNGPLVLASATSVVGGGRLAVMADADLAANGFVLYGGNLSFLNNTLFWLLGAEEDLSAPAPSGSVLNIDRGTARLLFWVPAVIWPLLVLSVWYAFNRKRHKNIN